MIIFNALNPPIKIQIEHYFGICSQCKVYQTDKGIGGQCIHCVKIHGWLSSEEILEITKFIDKINLDK
tara:strand:- start:303 stop:506 length:204 start_codon:yes stop_codon:yes gene_type:complete